MSIVTESRSMIVQDKITKEVFTVYAIQNNQLLIYNGDEFEWVLMEDYEPYQVPVCY